MQKKIHFVCCSKSLAVILLLFIAGNTFAQPAGIEAASAFQKRNGFQYISYKPAKAKNGKDGRDRMLVIQLIKGPKSGKAGKDGADGPDLDVRIGSLQMGDSVILQLLVFTRNHPIDTFYVNPRFGQLKIAADGGDGGVGGKGEDGGGSDGRNGKGGNGGSIGVTLSRELLAYASGTCLIFSNEGGTGAYSGYDVANQGAAGKKGPPIQFKDEMGKILLIR